MATDYFSILGLPVEPIEPDQLREAYRRQRTLWFMRQSEPEYLTQATKQLESIDEAYRILSDPIRQKAVARQLREASSPVPQNRPEQPPPASAGASRPLVNRTIVIRQMLHAAESLLASGGALDEPAKKRLVRMGFSQGLDYADAVQVTERIAARLRT